MAISIDVPSIYADPSKILDPRKTARILANELDVDLDRIYQRLASDKVFVWLKRQVTPKVADKIKALKLEGVHFLGLNKNLSF